MKFSPLPSPSPTRGVNPFILIHQGNRVLFLPGVDTLLPGMTTASPLLSTTLDLYCVVKLQLMTAKEWHFITVGIVAILSWCHSNIVVDNWFYKGWKLWQGHCIYLAAKSWGRPWKWAPHKNTHGEVTCWSNLHTEAQSAYRSLLVQKTQNVLHPLSDLWLVHYTLVSLVVTSRQHNTWPDLNLQPLICKSVQMVGCGPMQSQELCSVQAPVYTKVHRAYFTCQDIIWLPLQYYTNAKFEPSRDLHVKLLPQDWDQANDYC